MSKVDEIEKLAKLRKGGLITDKEYDKVLDGLAAANDSEASVTYIYEDAYSPAPNYPEKNWSVAVCLSLFFGMIGLDLIYLGHFFKGLLKLCTFGGFGIWWLVDLYRIATKKYPGITWIL